MKHILTLLAAAFALLLLSACAVQPAAVILPNETLLPTLAPLPTATPFPTVTLTPAPTATRTRIPSPTPTQTNTPTLTPTAVPEGTFALLWYKPLVISYSPDIWEDKSEYRNTQQLVNYLKAKGTSTCAISIHGPTGFNGPAEEYIWGKAQLGEMKYATLQFTEPGAERADFYFPEDPIAGYDSSIAIPILVISANEEEWEACKKISEEVLSTLHAGSSQ